ncbi:hypothetical protein [Hydrocarboniphaga sp.]|uniref:hypothetical protein n=1 Tax=Hydrocarboniphaga sp. TaxID=2033016 RepID=UPI002AC98FEB|nr:hypothetical protein [Hydrocarboniphaga sp.]
MITLTADERRRLSTMADKLIGFEDKAKVYMNSNPEFMPGFLPLSEVTNDRELRGPMSMIFTAVSALTYTLDDTYLKLNSEIHKGNLAYYNTVREAASGGLPGAKAIYEDTQKHFPGAPTKAQRKRKAAEAAEEAAAGR